MADTANPILRGDTLANLDLLRTAHSQIRHLIDDLTVAVDDGGLTHYAPRPGVLFSNLISALIPLAGQMRLALDAGTVAPAEPLYDGLTLGQVKERLDLLSSDDLRGLVVSLLIQARIAERAYAATRAT